MKSIRTVISWYALFCGLLVAIVMVLEWCMMGLAPESRQADRFSPEEIARFEKVCLTIVEIGGAGLVVALGGAVSLLGRRMPVESQPMASELSIRRDATGRFIHA